MSKKKLDFSCFYLHVECKPCGLVYTCTPSLDLKSFIINAPKRCVKCNKLFKFPKWWARTGAKINTKEYPKIKGHRLLLDGTTPNFKLADVVCERKKLEKSFGKKVLNKLLK